MSRYKESPIARVAVIGKPGGLKDVGRYRVAHLLDYSGGITTATGWMLFDPQPRDAAMLFARKIRQLKDGKDWTDSIRRVLVIPFEFQDVDEPGNFNVLEEEKLTREYNLACQFQKDRGMR